VAHNIHKNIALLSEQGIMSSMYGPGSYYGTYGYNDKGQTILTKYVNSDLESDLRDFLYSPAGIATIAGIDYLGGAPLSMTLFAILVAYDVKKWIDMGEPNWLFLITDLICVATAGFANSVASPLIKAAKNIKFKSLTSFLKFVQKNFKSIWENFILPSLKSIGGIIKKVITLLTKSKPSLSKKLSSSISSIVDYLSKLNGIIEESLRKVIGDLGLVTGKTYAKYKIASTAASEVAKTETGKKILRKTIPVINPLLGSDKIDPFLMDLITSPRNIDVNNYRIHPSFADNSRDTF
jgi:hypothetical protein